MSEQERRLRIAFVMIGIAMLNTGCEMFHNGPAGPGPAPDLVNEGFGLKYSAELKPSSPTSFTATFDSRDLLEASTQRPLASIANAKVTLVQSVDANGAPVWHETFELFVTSKGYATVASDTNRIRFTSAVRNQAGGPIDKDTTTSSENVACGGGAVRIQAQRDLQFNPIGPSFQATIDVGRVRWKKC